MLCTQLPDAILSKIVLLLNLASANHFVSSHKLIKTGTSEAWSALVSMRKIKRFWKWCKRCATTEALARAFMRTKLGDPRRVMELAPHG